MSTGRNYSLRPGEKGNWISALEAVHLLAPTVGGDRKAKKALVERLKDGVVEATAWWTATGYDVSSPYMPKPLPLRTEDEAPSLSPAELHDRMVENSKPEVSETSFGTNKALKVSSGNLFIGAGFWSMASSEDRKQWDWSIGLFKSSYLNPDAFVKSSTISATSIFSRMRIFALGVHFHRPDVERIIGSLPLPQQQSQKTERASNAGRKRSADWPRWIAELIWLVQEKKDVETWTANRLIQMIEDRVACTYGQIPGRSAVYSDATEILRLLKGKKAGEDF